MIGPPEIYQRGPNMIRDAKAARIAARVLEEHGWLEPLDGGAVVRGCKRLETWRIVEDKS